MQRPADPKEPGEQLPLDGAWKSMEILSHKGLIMGLLLQVIPFSPFFTA